MDVFLLRTSLAEDLSPEVPEAHRFLSREGRQLVRALGHVVRHGESLAFDRIVVSPSAVAAQTAELFAERVDFLGVVEVLPALAPGVPPQIAAPLLLAGRGAKVVVVADEPALSALGAFLIGRPTFPPLLHAQLSVIEDRKPGWSLRPGESTRSLLLTY